MSIAGDLIRGHTDAIILARLLKSDSYGYEINKMISTLSSGRFELKEATLYTAFKRLEDAGHIAARRKYSVIAQLIHQDQTARFGAEQFHAQLVKDLRPHGMLRSVGTAYPIAGMLLGSRIVSGIQIDGAKSVSVRRRRTGDKSANRPLPLLQQTTGKGGFSHAPLSAGRVFI